MNAKEIGENIPGWLFYIFQFIYFFFIFCKLVYIGRITSKKKLCQVEQLLKIHIIIINRIIVLLEISSEDI